MRKVMGLVLGLWGVACEATDPVPAATGMTTGTSGGESSGLDSNDGPGSSGATDPTGAGSGEADSSSSGTGGPATGTSDDGEGSSSGCLDEDGDGVCVEECPEDPDKTEPGVCGCGVPDTDMDGDGDADCIDGCPDDPDKAAPGVCGCGVPDTDMDGDGDADCIDGCPGDPDKTEPGLCGCGVSDVDMDGDGEVDCIDGCPGDPDKTEPGLCGCGVPDIDMDGDGEVDCIDGCPGDPDKTAPGICGCGVPDIDMDGDGAADCIDQCPGDPGKTAVGDCGCGMPDIDTDGDGDADCIDGCVNDPGKTAPGVCGCGVPDTDTDGDGEEDCIDGCVNDPGKTAPGVCGCGIPDTDTDGDGTEDCNDLCPDDPGLTVPGPCGCNPPPGLLECSGSCVDPNSDATYCGAAADCQAPNDGVVCAVAETCIGGACIAPPASNVTHLAVGTTHTCALHSTGAVRCWGEGTFGQLGYGNTADLGDNETLDLIGDVDVGGAVVDLAAGRLHTCAVLDTGAVRCWGSGSNGKLGYGNTMAVGATNTPSAVGDVVVGGTVVGITAGELHTCALLDTGSVRCWGNSFYGQLGYGNFSIIGDNEDPALAGNVSVGGAVASVSAGRFHTCALLVNGNVRCWGFGNDGQLGYGNTQWIGDNESPASAGDVDIGGPAIAVSAGDFHTCALLEGGGVRCWGSGALGRLGYGNTDDIGDDESPASAGDVDVGGAVVAISAGGSHTCARLALGNIRCWGSGTGGRLGYDNEINIGDNEVPAAAGDVDVGGLAFDVVSGGHTCARMVTGSVRCWGPGDHGKLGYGNTLDIGDNELPAAAGDVPLWP